MQGARDEEEHEVLYVGCLAVEIEPDDQEVSYCHCQVLRAAPQQFRTTTTPLVAKQSGQQPTTLVVK